LYLGDNLLKGGIKIFVDEYGNNGEDIVVLLNEVEHPERFGVAEIDNQGQIKRLIEKPSQFISNKALVGIYIFNYKIFSAVKSIKPSWRRELEITDAIQYVIDHNGVVCPYIIQNWWKDTGKKEDVLEANRFILDYIDIDNKGNVDINSNIIGRVNIEVGSYVKNSIIHGPVLIGKDVLIEDAYIGPYTSIGDRVQIINSELEQSIIMEDACIIDVKFRIADSLIGRSVNINSKKKKPAILELIIGDQSQINMYNN
jgi:glucose-1-phosphate thymidylyltransferase